jgi:hypothetical protein
MSLDVNMVKPALRASGMGGKADTKKRATKATQNVRVSHTVEGLQKEKALQKANAKDNGATVSTKSLPTPQHVSKHKVVQACIPGTTETHTTKEPINEPDSLHCAVATTSIDKSTKIHITATKGPPCSPIYFISERRTYAQRVKNQIEEAEERERPHYSKKSTKKPPYLPSTQFPQKTIRLSPDYWNTRYVHHKNASHVACLTASKQFLWSPLMVLPGPNSNNLL